MYFDLSEEQNLYFETAYAFGQEQIAPHAYAWDKAGEIPREVLAAAGELGFGAIYVPEELGGTGLSRLDATLIFEGLSMACPSVAAFISIHNMCTNMVAKYATASFKDAWLERLTSLQAYAAYCLTEPGSGSDAAALRTKAEKTDDGFALTGNKAFISGGGYADLYLVMSRTGDQGPKGISTLAVPDGADGLSFGAAEHKMGWKSQPTAQVQMDACQVPADHLLGEEGRGFNYAMEGLDGGRLNIASCSLGAASQAMSIATKYMGERQAFGQSLDQFQALQFKLAEMETKLQAARVFLRQAAWKLDNKAPDATKHCAMAKLFVTDHCFDVANDALQMLGGYGYLEDYGIEKLVRDMRVHQILEGTNQIMRMIISRAVLMERDRS
ncbi:acyl-CoA dehydrogenase [Amylibacter marinus]|uniref:Acyl-CoA dehydrogenase n=1 Tax=Amylibacter marinus TaxID=1475483 RepID=A0ABQ5VVL9_9RHOB|nr:acyl-CoA dehydrogenase family protein [Amylibacter marinus]GLQ35313.1 acyl-CoA dehydrogenase [Amylibacter marinus]